MKAIASAPELDAFSLSLYFSSGRQRYYHANRPRRSEYVFLPERPEWCPVWATAIFREEMLPNTCHRREFADFLAVEHVVSGSLLFRQEGRCYLVEAGDSFLSRPCSSHDFATRPGERCVKSSVMMRGPLLTSLLDALNLSSVDVLPGFDGAAFESLLDALRDLSNGHCDPGRLACLSYELLVSLVRRSRSEDPPEELRGLLSFMEANLASKLTLGGLASRAGRSVPSLIRLFNASAGASPMRTLGKMRMREAARLLLEREDPVKEIAAKVGYDNPLNFSTEFKKRFGVSPKAYRHGGDALCGDPGAFRGKGRRKAR